MPVTIVFLDGAKTAPVLQTEHVMKWLRAAHPTFSDADSKRRQIADFLARVDRRYGFLQSAEFLHDLVLFARSESSLRELDAIRKAKPVTGLSALGGSTPARQTVTVGVSFRTDGSGTAHIEHDLQAIMGLNQLLDSKGQRLFPFDVVGVGLPRGASGSATPARNASASELDDIDLLYIPGAPAANDTQIDQPDSGHLQGRPKTHEGQNLNTAKRKDNETAQRVMAEHRSRAAYELQLLGMAKTRGIPVLAVCAGSWRLLESYGGTVRTLEVTQRAKHKAVDSKQTWALSHALKVMGGQTLVKLLLAKGITLSEAGTFGIDELNSTHWAVASTQDGELARGSGDPSKLLSISAVDPDTDTVEAFESLYGAPVMGIQWHPECYLPGMQGDMNGQASLISRSLFEFMAFAAATSAKRRSLLPTLDREGSAFTDLCSCARLLAKESPVGAGNSYVSAVSKLNREKWSARMLDVDEAITMLGDSFNEMANEKPVAAGNLYRGAQSTLRQYGVVI